MLYSFFCEEKTLYMYQKFVEHYTCDPEYFLLKTNIYFPRIKYIHIMYYIDLQGYKISSR
jgi:hypothetical protein